MTREPQPRTPAPAEAGRELPDSLTSLGARLRATPAPELRERQLDRAIAAVRPVPTPAPRRPALPRTLRGRAAVAACAAAIGLPGIAATLAVAGVKLPEPAVAAFEAVGLTLPNQADEARPSRAPDARGDGAGEGARGADERGRVPASGRSLAPARPVAPARSTPPASTPPGVPDSVPPAAGGRPGAADPAAGGADGAGPGSPPAKQPPASPAPTELPGAPPQVPESAPAGPATGADRGEPRPAPRGP